jgi:hypothetical protein
VPAHACHSSLITTELSVDTTPGSQHAEHQPSSATACEGSAHCDIVRQVRNAKKLIVVGAGTVAAGVASLALMSTGVAGAAPDESGKTYSEALADLKAAGYTAVMSTVVGDKVAQGDCTVVRQNSTKASAFVGGGVSAPSSAKKVYLSLDCTKPPASSSGG